MIHKKMQFKVKQRETIEAVIYSSMIQSFGGRSLTCRSGVPVLASLLKQGKQFLGVLGLLHH